MFDLNTPIMDSEYGEELDEVRLERYIHDLRAEFEESAEAQVLMAEFETSLCWPAIYMHYAAQYFCATPVTVTTEETAEILFEIFPRKVSVEADAARGIVAELRAFWQFLKRTRCLESADAILGLLTDENVDRLEAELADLSNFGIAKSIFAAGMTAGFDMTDQDDMNRFVLAYNASKQEGSAFDDGTDLMRPTPRSTPPPQKTLRVGRNDQCPCGSGRKYKKCCLN